MIKEIKYYLCTICQHETRSTKYVNECSVCARDKCPNCKAPHWDSLGQGEIIGLWYVEKDLSKELLRGAYCNKCGWKGSIEEVLALRTVVVME